MKTIKLFCCFAVLATITSGLKIRCKYFDELHYVCFAEVISADNPTKVTEVSGTHLSGKSNADVTRFSIWAHRPLKTIPKGLGNFFPNLELFHWPNGLIASIDSSTFSPFPHLLDIDHSFNELVTLDGDLFKNTRKLQVIYFSGNKLKHIGHGHNLLTELYDLRNASFSSNPCINATAIGAKKKFKS